MSIPRIVIAGTNSGCGKTTVASGIMAALVKKGLKVQPFKVGPDFIDPMFHTFVTGRHSRNLDSWMLEEDTLRSLMVKNSVGADVAVIEGVMGLYDGLGGNSTTASTAHVSKITNSPVILVVNGEGASLSLSAAILGFKAFDRDTGIRGVIINGIKSESHYKLLKETIEENTGVMVAGYLPKNEGYTLASRHLGLVPSEEIEGLREKLDIVAEDIAKFVDLELLMKLAGDAGKIKGSIIRIATDKDNASNQRAVIGVALDKAFNFYYRDNLELLEEMGAELRYFSPLKDSKLPEGLHGLYIGGGYPEVWARELEENSSMRRDIYNAVENGLPMYAECGGLMYMSGSITGRDGVCREMTGVVKGKSRMTSSLQRFGYVEVRMTGGSVLSEQPSSVKAHEFHYSATDFEDGAGMAFEVIKQRRGREPLSWKCGYRKDKLLAGYPHIHFWGNTELAKGFVNSCRKYKQLIINNGQ